LPAKVLEVNNARAAFIRSTTAGPFVIPSSFVLQLSFTAVNVDENPASFGAYPLIASGSRTAAQVASDVNASSSVGTIATVDVEGRLVITSPFVPSAVTDNVSLVVVAPNAAVAGLDVFGWDRGGEKERRSPIYPPTRSAVLDGWPQSPVAQIGQGFVVVIGGRPAKMWGPVLRRDEYEVELNVALFHFVDAAEAGLGREHISSVVRCVREVLMTDRGHLLGRESQKDVMLALVKGSDISERPFKWLDGQAPNSLFDVGSVDISVRVFERPAQF
jgi:hypothetical protein